MRILTGAAQEAYWKRARYRSGHDPVAVAYALPKLVHIQKHVDLSHASILDVACGTGLFTQMFETLSPRVVGVDCSPSMLQRNGARSLLQAQGEGLPFQSGSFDVTFAANLLHHTAEPQRVVDEMARVSRRHVVIIEPNRWNPVMGLFSLLVPAEHGGLRSSRSYLTRLLRGARLSVVACSAMGLISQNNTPGFLVPLLRAFDREFALGEYLVAIGAR